MWNSGNGKAIECSKLGELFCGSLEDKIERNADDGGLAYEVPERSLRDAVASRPPPRPLHICFLR